MSVPKAIAYTGYPGAGKTEAAKFGQQWVGGDHISMGESVKEIALDLLGPEATSHEIGHWATVSREVSGPDVMARYLVEKWQADGFPEQPVHIEGVRSIYEIIIFQQVFGAIPIIFVEADFEARLRRLKCRGRDGESTFRAVDLAERDRREAKWGIGDLDLLSQNRVPNDDELSTLNNRIGSRLTNILGIPNQ